MSSVLSVLRLLASTLEASFPLEDTCFLARGATSFPLDLFLGFSFSETNRILDIINKRGKRVYIPSFTSSSILFPSSLPLSSGLDASGKYSNQHRTLGDVTLSSAFFIFEKS